MHAPLHVERSAGADLQGQREDLEHQQLLEQQQTVNDSAAALDPAAAAAAPVPAAPDSAAAAELAAAAVAQLAHMSAADQQVHASAAAAQHGLALHQQLDAAAAAAAAAAALGGMPNLSAGGLALDPAAAAALAAHGIGVAPLGLPGLLDASGQPLALLHQGLELAAAAGDAALFAQLGGHAGMGMGSDDMGAHMPRALWRATVAFVCMADATDMHSLKPARCMCHRLLLRSLAVAVNYRRQSRKPAHPHHRAAPTSLVRLPTCRAHCLPVCSRCRYRCRHFVPSDAHRSHLEGVRKADYQALATAKRQGQLATIQFVLDLSPELSDIDVAERCGGAVCCFSSAAAASLLPICCCC